MWFLYFCFICNSIATEININQSLLTIYAMYLKQKIKRLCNSIGISIHRIWIKYFSFKCYSCSKHLNIHKANVVLKTYSKSTLKKNWVRFIMPTFEWPLSPVKTKFMSKQRAVNHYSKLFLDHSSYVCTFENTFYNILYR